jgi:hypothetical protein
MSPGKQRRFSITARATLPGRSDAPTTAIEQGEKSASSEDIHSPYRPIANRQHAPSEFYTQKTASAHTAHPAPQAHRAAHSERIRDKKVVFPPIVVLLK